MGPAGRLEFAAYLPPNCQAALIQPVGKDGVLVVGSDTQRGFSRLDQVREVVMRDAVLWLECANWVKTAEAAVVGKLVAVTCLRSGRHGRLRPLAWGLLCRPGYPLWQTSWRWRWSG